MSKIKFLTIDFEDDIYDRLQELAKERNVGFNEFVNDMARLGLKVIKERELRKESKSRMDPHFRGDD